MTNARLLEALATRKAQFSDCGLYRYSLEMQIERHNDSACLWVLANPSTANEEADDPTTRKVCQFTRSMGFTTAIVVNLCAFRTPHPSKLELALSSGVDVVGPLNYRTIGAILDRPEVVRVVYAWGNCLPFDRQPVLTARGRVNGLVQREGFVPYCMGRTAAGNPKHPLWLPRGSKPSYFPSGHQKDLEQIEGAQMALRASRRGEA